MINTKRLADIAKKSEKYLLKLLSNSGYNVYLRKHSYSDQSYTLTLYPDIWEKSKNVK